MTPPADRLEDLKVRAMVYGVLAFVTAVGWLILCTFVGWFLPGPRPDRQLLNYAQAHLASTVSATVGVNAADPSVYRVEPRAVGNVRVYIPKAAWDRIPYPDRDDAAAAIGKAWCGSLPLAVKVFLPVVVIRDIRSGDDIDHYSCIGPHW